MPSSASSSVATMRAAASTSSAPLAIARVSSRCSTSLPARRDQHQVVEAHHLHGARRGADIAGVAGARSRMKRVLSAAGVCMGSPPKITIIGSPRRPLFPSASPPRPQVAPCRKRSIPCSTSPSRPRATAGALINRASLELDLLKVSTKAPNDFVTEVDQAAERDDHRDAARRLPGPRRSWPRKPAASTAPATAITCGSSTRSTARRTSSTAFRSIACRSRWP